jgi:hypothetical protein
MRVAIVASFFFLACGSVILAGCYDSRGDRWDGHGPDIDVSDSAEDPDQPPDVALDEDSPDMDLQDPAYDPVPTTETWILSFSTSGYDEATSVIESRDGGYLVSGNTIFHEPGYPRGWIIRLGEDGRVLWQRITAHDDLCAISAIAETEDGGVVAAGPVRNDGEVYALVTKLDREGRVLWQKSFSAEKNDMPSQVLDMGGGQVLVAGHSEFAYGSEQMSLWFVVLDAHGNAMWGFTGAIEVFRFTEPSIYLSVEKARDGGIYWMRGMKSTISPERTELSITKFDAGGSHLWTYWSDQGWSVDIAGCSDGGLAVAGGRYVQATRTRDFWLIRLDSEGNQLWTRMFGSAGNDWITSVAEDRDGNLLLSGYTEESAGNHIWLARADAEGSLLWQEKIGGPHYSSSDSAIETTDGHIVLAGTGAWNYENNDLWIAMLDESGGISEGCSLIETMETYDEDSDNSYGVSTDGNPWDFREELRDANVPLEDPGILPNVICPD